MRVTKPKEIAKIIHLPNDTIKILDELAIADRTKTKPYMEKILIEHSKKQKK